MIWQSVNIMTLLEFQKVSYYPEFTVPQEARQSQISPNKYANYGVTDPRDTLEVVGTRFGGVIHPFQVGNHFWWKYTVILLQLSKLKISHLS